jgi:hypothetical protein
MSCAAITLDTLQNVFMQQFGVFDSVWMPMVATWNT